MCRFKEATTCGAISPGIDISTEALLRKRQAAAGGAANRAARSEKTLFQPAIGNHLRFCRPGGRDSASHLQRAYIAKVTVTGVAGLIARESEAIELVNPETLEGLRIIYERNRGVWQAWNRLSAKMSLELNRQHAG